jgi:hypothetical protein
MASITITVQSLLNAAQFDEYTVDDGDTVAELKIIIDAATGIDSAWYNVSFNREVLEDANTLASYDIIDGSVLGTGNIISGLTTLQDRQLAKLNLAALDRTADGNPQDEYDITELPSQYIGNVSTPNPHPNGLLLGRPWYSTTTTVTSFTTVGTTTWTAPANIYSVEYLIVGGGGGAGNGYDNAGGGGGGAGMVLTDRLSVTPGQTYTVTIGAGGTGGADTRTNNPGLPGNASVFSTVIALGGGQGLGSRTGGTPGAAQVSTTTAPTGGSGSGGGNGGKGGGGATAAGTANTVATPGNGGAGLASSITGSSVTYGVGGAGGGAGTPTTDGANGTANRGNGGQGGKSGSADSAKGGDGGSGIVVLLY